jgi:hypothetical protein
MIRATTDSAAQLSKLALSLYNANMEAHAALGMHKPSTKVAIAYCIVLATPEFKHIGVRITASNNIWLKIQQENHRLDREAKEAK